MKVLVTGCTGFIGSHLIPELSNSGYEVEGTVERGTWSTFSEIPTHTVDIATGDGVHGAFTGVEAVIHLAARNHVLQEKGKDLLAEYRRINVVGANNVVRAASSVGVKVFIHLSSLKAMGEGSDKILNEDDPCLPRTHYGISKLESEEVVREEAARSGMRAVILRLPMVYGPCNKGNLPRMIRWADKGLPFPLLQPANMRSMVYVGNVVAGIMAFLKNAREGVTTYFLKDRDDYSTRIIYEAICRALEKTPRFIPVPGWAVRFGGMVSEDFRKITGSFRVSSAKIEREVGFTPPVSFEEGIARTVRWYKGSAR